MMSNSTTRVLIADSYPCSRIGLYQILSDAGFHIVAEVNCDNKLYDTLSTSQPCVLLLASNLLPDPPIPFLKELRQSYPETSIVLFLNNYVHLSLQDISDSGIRGMLSKADPINFIVQAIKAAANGGTVFSSKLFTKTMTQNQQTTESEINIKLTKRENELLSLLCDDKSNQEIAKKLNLSRKTVEKQLTALYAKLAVKTRTGAVVWFMQHRENRGGGGGNPPLEIIEKKLPKCRGFPVGTTLTLF